MGLHSKYSILTDQNAKIIFKKQRESILNAKMLF